MPTFTLLPHGRRQWIRALSVAGGFVLLLCIGGCRMISMPGHSHAPSDSSYS